MLQVQSIHYAYHKSFELNDISFELDTGETLGIIGESGCGKTTLLKLIFGKLDTDLGEMYWNSEKIMGPSHQLIPGKEDFKYVTQDFELMPYITVLENIIKPLSRQYPEDNIKRAKELLKVVKLEEHKDKKVVNLSGGQKQRVALAQALARTPKLLLLDEPFSHIDSFFKNELRRDLFQFMRKENITCIVATHDNGDVLPFADKIMVLKQGKTIDYDTPENVYRNPKHHEVAGLFGDYNLVDTMLIAPELDSRKVVVYPNELEFVKSPDDGLEIIDQYFMGQYYKVLVIYKNQRLIVHASRVLITTQNYTIKFKVDRILKRINP